MLENPERAMGVSRVGAWRAVQKKGVGGRAGARDGGAGGREKVETENAFLSFEMFQ